MRSTLPSLSSSSADTPIGDVLTAAHCVDLAGGQLPNGAGMTGDGIIDFAPNEIRVFLNHNNPSNDSAGATAILASNIDVHPDWFGFLDATGPNVSIHDDIAVLKLASPAPPGVPVYPLDMNPFNNATAILPVGYGTSGDASNGANIPADFFVKRWGVNLASRFALDDEGSPAKEVFVFDFDGDGTAFDTLKDGLTFGNFEEVTIAGGDSGGPSFLWSDVNNDSLIDQGELSIFGVDTFTRGLPNFSAPHFGSQAGGMLLSNYEPWVTSVVPEPTGFSSLILSSVLLLAFRRTV